MLLRFLLTLAGALVGFEVLQWGARSLAPIEPALHFTILGAFPWIAFDFATDKEFAFFVALAGLAALTCLAILKEVGRLFALRAKYVSRWRIVYLGVLLAASAVEWGGFASQVANVSSLASYFAYPQVGVTILIFTPIALLFLNFLREIARAISEYEARVAHGEVGPKEVAQEIELVRKQVVVLTEHLVSLEQAQKANLNGRSSELKSIDSKIGGLYKEVKHRQRDSTPPWPIPRSGSHDADVVTLHSEPEVPAEPGSVAAA